MNPTASYLLERVKGRKLASHAEIAVIALLVGTLLGIAYADGEFQGHSGALLLLLAICFTQYAYRVEQRLRAAAELIEHLQKAARTERGENRESG